MRVKVFVVDEVKNEDLEIKTFDVKSDYTLFELQENYKQLKDLFHKVLKILEMKYNISKLESKIYQFDLEMIGDFQQKTKHGNNCLRLKLKIVSC